MIAFAVPGFGAAWSFVAVAVAIVGFLTVCFAFRGVIAAGAGQLARLFGPPGTLARVGIGRAPKRVWITAMTVGIAVAVGITTSASLGDLVRSGTRSLESLRAADVYVSSTAPEMLPAGALLPADTAAKVRAVPGVERVVEVQFAYLNLGETKILVQGVENGSVTPPFDGLDPKLKQRLLSGDGVVLSRQLANTLGVSAGSVLDLPTPAGTRPVRVLDEVGFLSTGFGLMMMSGQGLREVLQNTGATYLEVFGAPGADAAGLATAVRGVTPEGLRVYTGDAKLDAVSSGIDQIGALAVGIQWIVGAVAALAVLNILMLSVLERRRELGVFRAIGATRRFSAGMMIAETLAVSALGGIVGYLAGELLHYLFIDVLSVSTAFDIDFHISAGGLVYVAAATVLCALGGLIPGIQIARMNVIEAIADE